MTQRLKQYFEILQEFAAASCERELSKEEEEAFSVRLSECKDFMHVDEELLIAKLARAMQTRWVTRLTGS